MNEKNEHLNALRDIKQMMERSSRFISLSGLSGIAAGVCAIAGSWYAHKELYKFAKEEKNGLPGDTIRDGVRISDLLYNHLFIIALLTFTSAFLLAFFFTYLRSKKTGIPIWGVTARRLMINVLIPMIAGALFLLKAIDDGAYGLIAPGCLLFYGLAVVNASKYTLHEILYLGYGMIILALINLWIANDGLTFWAIGFGLFHIIYGVFMWLKYERN